MLTLFNNDCWQFKHCWQYVDIAVGNVDIVVGNVNIVDIVAIVHTVDIVDC